MQPKEPTSPQSPQPLGPPWTDATCPVARALDLVGDRWSLLIVRDAMDGCASFSDFHARLGIARNILSDRLKTLVARGILTRAPTAGRRRTYVLTPAGRDLFTTVVALRQWGERNAFDRNEAHSVLVDDQGATLQELHALSSAGRTLELADTHVQKIST